MEIDAISGKGKGKEKSGKGKKVARKEKKATQAKVTKKRQQSVRVSRVSVETAERTDTKLLTVVQASARTSGQRQGLREVEIQSDRNQ